MTENALAMLPAPERARAVLAFDETKAKLAELATKYADITAVTNKAGRDQAHAAAMELRDVRLEIQRRGKQAREDATAYSKAVIATENELTGIVEPEEDRLKALRDEWDAAREAEKRAAVEAEQRRVEGIRARIAQFGAAATAAVPLGSEALEGVLAALQEPRDPAEFAEFAEQAAAAQATACEAVGRLLDAAREREAEARRLADERAQLEAERKALEAERAEAQAKADAEAAERRRAEDEARAAREAQERAQREQEAAERAERQRIEDEQRAAIKAQLDAKMAEVEAERKRQADEAEAKAREEAERAAAEERRAAEEARAVSAAEFRRQCETITLPEAARYVLGFLRDEGYADTPAELLLEAALSRESGS